MSPLNKVWKNANPRKLMGLMPHSSGTPEECGTDGVDELPNVSSVPHSCCAKMGTRCAMTRGYALVLCHDSSDAFVRSEPRP